MNAALKSPPTAAEAEFARLFAALPADAKRQAAFRGFAARGLPTRRDEAWHYTDLRAAWRNVAPSASMADAAAMLRDAPRWATVRLAVVDGRFAPEISDPVPEGVTISAETTPIETRGEAPLELNVALAVGGVCIEVAAAAKVAIEIVHVVGGRDAQSVQSRVGLGVRAGAHALIIERVIGGNAGTQRNLVTSIDLEKGAAATRVVVVADDSAIHLETLVVDLAEDATLTDFGFVSGGALTRRSLFVAQKGERAKIALGGLALIDGTRHADTTLVMDHQVPNSESREYYKHVVADEGTGVFQGKVIVRQHAQKTDGGMKSHALLLSPRATMNNKPELEIFADDVVCAC